MAGNRIRIFDTYIFDFDLLVGCKCLKTFRLLLKNADAAAAADFVVVVRG